MTQLAVAAPVGPGGGGGGIPLAPPGGFRGFGPLGLEGRGGQDAIGVFTKFISSTIGLLTVVAILWFIFLFIAGAIGLMSAGGDKAAVESARSKITSGLIGLIVVIAAIFVIDLLGTLFGIPNILNVSDFVGKLSL